MPNEIQRMLPRHMKILDLCLEGKGRKAIAEEVGLHVQSISNIFNSPLFQEELARRRTSMSKAHDQAVSQHVTQAKAELEGSAVEAARTHIRLLGSEDDRTAQSSATAILDRVGLGKAEKDAQGDVVVINVEQMQLLNIALEESLQTEEAPGVLDAEVSVG